MSPSHRCLLCGTQYYAPGECDWDGVELTPIKPARCIGQEWDPFGVQPQCLDCDRYSSASMEIRPQSLEWIDPPQGDPCPQRIQRQGA